MLKKISFCGLSHLGLVYSSVYSNFSKKIVCFDENIELIGNLNKKQIDIDEPGLTKQIRKNFHKFKYFINCILEIFFFFFSFSLYHSIVECIASFMEYNGFQPNFSFALSEFNFR